MTRAAPHWLAMLPPGFGLLAVLLEKDDNFDLLNYHYYNAFAWEHGRSGQDLLPAGFQSFFNPLLDMPFYWANQHLPAIAISFLLGALAGCNAILIWLLARRLLNGPATLISLVALLGSLSAGSVYVLGTTYYDGLLGLPVFISLLLIARSGPAIFDGPIRPAIPVLLAAGLLLGLGVGLKQTTAPIAMGMGLALLATPGPIAQRLANATAFGIALVVGLLATSGFWLWHLWRHTGNPFFPYFNDAFQSPLAPIGNNRARHAMPSGTLEALTYPFVFTLAPWRIDSPVRDLKLLLAYMAVPIGIASALIGRRRTTNTLAEPRFALFLLLAAAASYAIWLWLFSIYRYLLPIEMLAPLLLVLAVGFLPLTHRLRMMALGLLLLLAAPIQVSNRDRRPWADLAWQPFIDVRLPQGLDLDGALVISTAWTPGWQPYGYVIPFLPPGIASARIEGRKASAPDLESRFYPMSVGRIARHRGPLYLLTTPAAEAGAAAALARLQLVADFQGCRAITGTVGPVQTLCPVLRE